MCQRDVGFFRHLPIAYADKKCGPQSLGGRHGITPTGRAIPSVVAPQQSHRPLHPTREVRHTLGIVEPHPYLRLGYEGCIAISGSTTRGCIAILGSIKRVYSQFRFSAPKCIAISGRSTGSSAAPSALKLAPTLPLQPANKIPHAAKPPTPNCRRQSEKTVATTHPRALQPRGTQPPEATHRRHLRREQQRIQPTMNEPLDQRS